LVFQNTKKYVTKIFIEVKNAIFLSMRFTDKDFNRSWLSR